MSSLIGSAPNQVPTNSLLGKLAFQDTPTMGWRDIIGNVQPKGSGAGTPARTVYRAGNVAQYAFIANDLCDFEFHMPHDWVVGTDLHFHVHWSHNGTAISGNAVFDFYYSIGKRDGTFGAEKDLTITYATVDVATTPRYGHRVNETQMTAATATATQAATSEVEVDALCIGTLKITTLPTITGGNLFIHTCDIHYQSNNVGTKNKQSDFYA